MRYFYQWLIGLICWGCTASAMASPVMLLDKPLNELHEQAQFFIDTTRSMTLDDVRAPATDQLFQPFGKGDLTYGGVTIWVKIRFKQTVDIPKVWWLEVRPVSLEYVTLYQVHKDGSVTQQETGRRVQPDPQVTGYHAPFLSLTTDGGGVQTLYLKVNPELYGISRIVMGEPAAFVAYSTASMLPWGICIGIFALLFVASMWFEKAVGDGVYRAFGLYALSSLLFTVTTAGIFFQYQTWLPLPAGTIPFVSWSALFGMFAYVNFFFRFVGMHTLKPRFTRYYLRSLKYFCFTIGVLLLIPEWSTLLRSILALTMVWVITPTTILSLWGPACRGSREVRAIFFFSAVLLISSLVYQYFAYRGEWRTPDLLIYAETFTILTLSLVIYYAISKRYQMMRQAKESAQKDMFEMMRHSERELDKQVQEKKRELLAAMTTVSRALSQERAAYEEQKNFIERVSEGLHTPLDIIDATTNDLAKEKDNMSPKMQMRLEKIKQSTSRLSALVKDYLVNNRLNAISRVVNASPLILHDVLNDAITAARPLAEHHVFVIDNTSMPYQIYADADLLRLVLRTLVDNAVKYTAPGTTITLRSQTVDNGWWIDVEDNGSGIDSDERPMVFDRYFRGRSASQRTGTGLGLPLAKRLMEMQGGTLTLLEVDHGGSIFRVFLPKPGALRMDADKSA